MINFPHINFLKRNSANVVKLLVDNNNKIHWMSRSDIPFFLNKKDDILKKHLSIIVFTMNSLMKYSKLKLGYFEKIESIELLRALENNMKMGSNSINSSSFSIDVIEDYRNAKFYLKKDKIKKSYI